MAATGEATDDGGRTRRRASRAHARVRVYTVSPGVPAASSGVTRARRCDMRIARFFYLGGVVALVTAGYLITTRTNLSAQQPAAVKIDGDDIGGVVASSKGPEGGVWVIAETTGLPTRYIKEVVTDDQGRYLIPDLPKAKYTVWARGYGDRARQAGESEANCGAGCQDRRPIVSGRILVCDAEGAGEKRVSGHGAVRQRHFAEHQNPGSVAAPH